MKKLDGFDYRKAEADLDNVGDCHPDEIYSYHSEKAVRGYMKEHGLNPDKYRSWIDYQRTGSSAAN